MSGGNNSIVTKLTARIFPVMPVSLAVELGRVRMPKAEPRWEIFDEHQARGGFVHALTIHPE